MNKNDIEALVPINKKSKKIKELQPHIRSTPTITIRSEIQMRFSACAATICKMYATTRFIHFFNPPDSKRWYFIVNEDANGWTIVADGSKRNAAMISSKPMNKLFRESVGANIGDRYHIQKTDATWKGCDLWEILTNKTVQQMGK